MQSAAQRRVLSHPLFWLVLFARFAAAAYILIDPLWGFVVTLAFDFGDAFVWMHTLGMSRKLYYEIDKPVDWISYVVMYTVGIRYGFFFILTPFLLYRMIGQIIFMAGGKQKHFILFPNFFEVVFFWVILGRQLGADMWSRQYLLLLGCLFMFKILQEIWIYHIWPARLRRHGYPTILSVFGQKRQVRWK